jgi:hypothetical protein
VVFCPEVARVMAGSNAGRHVAGDKEELGRYGVVGGIG